MEECITNQALLELKLASQKDTNSIQTKKSISVKRSKPSTFDLSLNLNQFNHIGIQLASTTAQQFTFGRSSKLSQDSLSIRGTLSKQRTLSKRKSLASLKDLTDAQCKIMEMKGKMIHIDLINLI